MAILFMLDFTNTLNYGLLRCARNDGRVCHCEERSDVAIHSCGLLRYARNDVGVWITVPATRNDGRGCHCEERSDVAIHSCGLLRCARNDVGVWITVPAARNDVGYIRFSDSRRQISAVLKSPRRRYSSLILRRKKASFFTPRFRSRARS